MRPSSPSMDIQISSNFERLLFEAASRDAACRARADGVAQQSGRFVLPDAVLAADPRRFRCRPRRRNRNRSRHPRRVARIRRSDRSAYRRRACRGRSGQPVSTVPNIVLSTAHAAKFPDAVEAACGMRPALPPMARRLMTKTEQIKVMKNDQTRGRAFRTLASAARQSRERLDERERHQARVRPHR